MSYICLSGCQQKLHNKTHENATEAKNDLVLGVFLLHMKIIGFHSIILIHYNRMDFGRYNDEILQ